MDSSRSSCSDEKYESTSVELEESLENQQNVDSSVSCSELDLFSPSLTWNLTMIDIKRLQLIFKKLNDSQDNGLVSFSSLQSYLSDRDSLINDFDFVWNLCDPDRSGKVTCDQFTVIMWIVEQSKKGLKIPTDLTETGMPERFTDALTTTYHNDAHLKCTKAEVNNHEELPSEHFEALQEILNIDEEVYSVDQQNSSKEEASLQDEENLRNSQYKATETLLQLHQDELNLEYSQNVRSMKSNMLLVPSQNELIPANSMVTIEPRSNLQINETIFEPHEINKSSKREHILILDTFKHFQNLTEEFENIFSAQTNFILREQTRNNHIFLQLKEFKHQIANLQEKCADTVREIENAISEFNNYNGFSLRGLNGYKNQSKDSLEMASQHSNSGWNPFGSSDYTLRTYELNQSTVSKSKNPFRPNTQLTPPIFGPEIETDTLSVPMLSSLDIVEPPEISFGMNESVSNFAPDQSSVSLPDLEDLMSSLTIQSASDNVDGYNSLLADSSTSSYSSGN